jgi:AcrR family transcriptional regulator
MPDKKTKRTDRTYTLSLANRKARGAGHERLAEILVAAKELFLEHGFENVSTRKIAERVGISQPALFAYYKSKDDIFNQLIRNAFGELQRALAEVNRVMDPRDWLRRSIEGYIAFGLGHPDEYRLAFMVVKPKPRTTAQAEEPSEGARVGVPVFMQLAAKVGEGIQAGAIRADLGPPILVAQALWASIHGLVAILISRPRPHFPWGEVDVLIKAQTEILLKGLLT